MATLGRWLQTKKEHDPVKVRKAHYDYQCECGHIIRKGEIHAGTPYRHVCLDCAEEPTEQWIAVMNS